MPGEGEHPFQDDVITGHHDQTGEGVIADYLQVSGEANTSAVSASGEKTKSNRNRLLKILDAIRRRRSGEESITKPTQVSGEADTSAARAPGGPIKWDRRTVLRVMGAGAGVVAIKAVNDRLNIAGNVLSTVKDVYNNLDSGQKVLKQETGQISQAEEDLAKGVREMGRTDPNNNNISPFPKGEYDLLVQNREYLGQINNPNFDPAVNNNLNMIKRGLGVIKDIYGKLSSKTQVDDLAKTVSKVSPDQFDLIQKFEAFYRSDPKTNNIKTVDALLADQNGVGLGWGDPGVRFIKDLVATVSVNQNKEVSVNGAALNAVLGDPYYINAFSSPNNSRPTPTE